MLFRSESENDGVSGKLKGIKRIFGEAAPLKEPRGRGKPLFPLLRVVRSLVLQVFRLVNSA